MYNITNHCLIRFFQRYQYQLINEDGLKNLRRDNPQEISLAEEKIRSLAEDASNKTFTLKDSTYIVNFNENWIFVIEKTSIVTCYPLKYSGVSEASSNAIVKMLIENELQPKIAEKEQLNLKYLDIERTAKDNINVNKDRIKLLRQQIELIEKENAHIEESCKIEKVRVENINFEVELLLSKIVKPDYFLK